MDIPIETVSNNKQRKYNHYTQQQRDKIEEALREHGNSWSGDIITKYMFLFLLSIHGRESYLKMESFKYCANRNVIDRY